MRVLCLLLAGLLGLVSAKHPELGESSEAELAALRLSAKGTATVKKFIAKEVQQRLAATDDGAVARCDKVHRQGKPGLKKCPKKTPGPNCPDGIGWQGVYFKAKWEWGGGMCFQWHSTDSALGRLRCEQHAWCIDRKTGKRGKLKRKQLPLNTNHTECHRLDRHSIDRFGKLIEHRDAVYPYKGFCRDKKYCDKYKGICDESYCDKTGAPQVCQKMQVIHVDKMSRSAGVLVMKRTSCDRDGKCSVFKAGVCIDLPGRDAWSYKINDHWKFGSILRCDGWNGRIRPKRCNLPPQHREGRSADLIQGGYKKQAKTFGKRARFLLRKFKNKLPPRYLCSGNDAFLGRQAIMSF